MADLKTRSHQLRPSIGRTMLGGLAPLAIVVALALVMQLVINPWLVSLGADFFAKMAVDVCIGVVLAVSLTMVNGFTGQFSIGHAAFMAVGAYTAAGIVYYGSYRLYGDAAVHGGLLSTMSVGREGVGFATGADLLFVSALLAGGVVAAACGYLVGLPSLRLKGDYLAIVTLGFGEIVRVLIVSQTTDTLYDADEIKQTAWYTLPKYLGGGLGFSGLPFYTSLFWVTLVMGITLIAAYRIKRSSFGRAFLSIREDEIAAEAMGINTTRYKVLAFVIAAFFAGVAGGLFAHTVGVQLNSSELGFQKSFDIIIMVVLGGLGSISGAMIAAVILTILPELLRNPPSLWPWGWLVVGLIAGSLLMTLPKGRKLKPLVLVFGIAIAWEAMRYGAKAAGITLSDYRMILYALLLIVMMIARPQGLMGVREVWERVFWRTAFGKSRPNEKPAKTTA